MMKIVFCTLAFFFTFALLPAQEASPGGTATFKISDPENEQRLRLANSSKSYPVTPGDVYRLTFRQGDVPISTDVLVESDFTINLSVLGRLNAAAMTFAELKPKVEKIVTNAYPRSMPSLTISAIGIFQVPVTGETPQSQAVMAWGLSRLSDIVEKRLGPFSSIRNIKVSSRGAGDKRYDLFKAYRLGLAKENPLMKPGDAVTLEESERTVELTGEVRQPGRYQLLSGEQLASLLDWYGGGLTANAEKSRVRIDRVSGQKVKATYFDVRDGYPDTAALEDGDSVVVAAKTSMAPVVFFEGAISVERDSTTPLSKPASEELVPATPVPYNRLVYSFKEGETLSDAISSVRKSISPLSDLAAAFVIRQGAEAPISVDLTKLFGEVQPAADMALRPFDRIVIPSIRFSVSVYGEVTRAGSYPYAPMKTFQYYVDLAGPGVENIPENIILLDGKGNTKDPNNLVEPQDKIYVVASFVTVQGAVFAPGRFPYRKSLPAAYYISLAGGIDPERNSSGKMTVSDLGGKTRPAAEGVRPGDQIYVHTDNPTYNFNKSFPTVSTAISLLVSVITLVVTVISVTH